MTDSTLTVEMVEDSVSDMPYGDEHPDSAIVLGGDMSAPTWDEYVSRWREEWGPRFVALRGFLVAQGLVGRRADEVRTDAHYFRFSDGATIAFSMRGWGDLMSAIVGKREGYLRYYC